MSVSHLARRAAMPFLAAALVCVGVAAPAHADGKPRPGVSVSPDGPSGAQVEVTQGSQSSSGGSPGSSGSGGSSNPGVDWDHYNTDIPYNNDPAMLGSCDPALYPNGYSDTLLLPAPCVQPGPILNPIGNQPPAPPQITAAMVSAAARVVAPRNAPHVEPGTVSYVHIPNNYWTDTGTVQDAVTVLGVTIPLTWTPTGTTWSFGDGASATGVGVAGADLGQADAIEHSYERQGSYAISTTTTYDLTFVIPGQGAQTIALTAPPSPPVTLPVREIQTRVSYAR